MAEQLISLLRNELGAVKAGDPPVLDLGSLLQKAGLDAPERDGKLLLQRFIRSDGRGIHRFTDIISEPGIEKLIGGLARVVLSRRANPGQEVLAVRLAGLSCAQIIREGRTCHYANIMLIGFVRRRPDLLVPLEKELRGQQGVPYLTPSAVDHLMEELCSLNELFNVNHASEY